jgi:membrane fusion protein, multidrug efflux system
MYRHCILVLLVSSVLAAIGGCQREAMQVAPPEPPAVPVSQPVQKDVTDYVEFTGRTDAVQAVNIEARVTGYLIKMPFKEGSEVRGDDRLLGGAQMIGLLLGTPGPLLAATFLFPGHCQEGDLLFEIDPRPYQAQLDQARGQVKLYEAQLNLAQVTYNRFADLFKTTPGAVSQQQLDQYKAQVEEAQAQLKAFQSSLEVYRLNLEFTRVTSPIDGRVSRYYLTLGNLVNQDQTLLTTVVSQDPMYAYFDTDEPTLLRLRRAVADGRIKVAERGENPVFMGLQDEEGFPHEGRINFVNNQVNPTTGSITMRGVFPNPKLAGGVRLLSPGMFVRIRLPIGLPHPARLIVDRAIGSDQGLKYVYVVDAENKVQYRRVKTGALQDNGLRVIEGGLETGDWVVVGGLQQVRPRMEVRPDKIAMPALGPSQEPEDKGQESGVKNQESGVSKKPKE